MRRVFLLSPANASGKRARMLVNPDAGFDLAHRLQTTGAPIGDLFAFVSGLYFRGKLAYARRFAAPEDIRVIVAGRGLLPAETVFSLAEFEEAATIPIDAENETYTAALIRDAACLDCTEAVLLGSVATKKYVDPLLTVLGDKLLFPDGFAGRGDMSRGGLLLRCAGSGEELKYVAAATAARHGNRPPKLPRIHS